MEVTTTRWILIAAMAVLHARPDWAWDALNAAAYGAALLWMWL